MKRVILAVDIGAESGRVMAAHWEGRGLRLEEVHRFPNGVIELAGTLRWNLPGLLEAVREGLRAAGARWPGEIASVGVDTWALDYVLLSRSGEMLGMPFCYRDGRTRGMVDELCRRVPRGEVFGSTGLQFMEINTLCQWMAHHRDSPEMLEAAAGFLMVPDWIHACLCGERAVEFTNATTTQFLDPRRRGWATGLLERLGLPTRSLGLLVEPGTRLGNLRGPVGDASGLGAVPVIAPATHDTASAVVGVPAARTGRADWAYISSGTWSLVGFEAGAPVLSGEALRLNVTNEGGFGGTWRVLKNVMGLWLVQQCRRRFAAAGGLSDYGALVAAASRAPAWRSLIDPDAPGFLNPPDMPEAIREACRRTGQPVPEGEGEVVRCALDSLALKYAVVLRQLEGLAGERFREVHVVGGGSRNDLLNALTAEVTGLPVVAGPVEATALGNALVQLHALGEVDGLGGMRALVSEGAELRRFEPSEGRGAAREAMGRFEALLGAGT